MSKVVQKNGWWWIDYFDQNGRRKRKKISPDKKTAQAVLNKRLTEIAERRYLDIDTTEQIRFKDFVQEFVNDYASQKKSFQSYLGYIRRLNPVFGDKFMSEIDSSMVEKYRLQRKKEVSIASVNREIACLKSIFRRAKEWSGKERQIIKENPLDRVKMEKENNARKRVLSTDEIRRLMLYTPKPLHREMYLIALNTGLRKANVSHLRRAFLNFEERSITIPGHLMKNGKEFIGPMNDTVYNILRFRFAESLTEQPYNFNCRKNLENGFRKAQIDDASFHTFRHTFSTRLDELNIDPMVVSMLLGHSAIGRLEITMRYIHKKFKVLIDAVKELDPAYSQFVNILSPAAEVPAVVNH